MARQVEGDRFAAYGVTPGLQDPVDVVLHQLVDELKRQQEEIEALKKR
jgi:hypothetical protein